MPKKITNPKSDGTEFFVSPCGSDKWSGTRPEPNARETDGPFATIGAAQRAIRSLKRQRTAVHPVRVHLRGGTHFLSKPLAFKPADSGNLQTKGMPRKGFLEQDNTIVYAAYEGEKPVLSGGRRITGWKVDKVSGTTVWVATIPQVRSGKWNFRQLWVNGQRRSRPSLPREGFLRVEKLARELKREGNPWCHGDDRFIYADGDLSADWRNLQDVEIVLFNYWVDSHMWIQRIDAKKRLVMLDRPSRTNLMDDRPVDGVRLGGCYRVENVFEEFKNPGEWYLDRPAGKLYYVPMPGEDIETAEIIAPRLDQLVRLEGGSLEDKPVENLRFEGITFSHTEWQLPEGVAASNQAANEVPGAVSLRNARNIRFENCAVANVGTYGIECLEGTRDIDIVRCRIADLGAGGVKVWHGCGRTLVCDNEIGDGGHIFHAGVGVLIGQSCGNRVEHNHVHDFDYTGVSVGWHWGYGEGDAYGNVIEWNHIHDIGHGMLSDMGGIYTLSVAPGTRLRYNLIHDVWGRTYGGWGIYPDEGSSFLLIENNIAYRTKTGGFHQHYGRENLVRNNIFAFAHEMQLQRSRLEAHDSFTFETNLVYLTEGPVWTGNWSENNAILRGNLYFDPQRKKLDFGGMTFRQWQKRGLDAGSIIADPKFVDPEKGDFRLKKGSPAIELGFVPFDLSEVGPREGMAK